MIDIGAELLAFITGETLNWGKDNIGNRWDDLVIRKKILSKYDGLVATKQYQAEFEKQGYSEGLELIDLLNWLKEKDTINQMMMIYTTADSNIDVQKESLYGRAYSEANIGNKKNDHKTVLKRQRTKWFVDFILSFIDDVFWSQLSKEQQTAVNMINTKIDSVANEGIKMHKKTQEILEAETEERKQTNNLLATLISNSSDTRQIIKTLPVIIKKGMLLNITIEKLAVFLKQLNIDIVKSEAMNIYDYIYQLSDSQIDDLYKIIPQEQIGKWIANYKKDYVIKKDFFKGFKNTNIYFRKFISGFAEERFMEPYKNMNSSLLDEYVLSILKILLYEEKYEILDLESMLLEVEKHHDSPSSFLLAKERWEKIIDRYLIDKLPSRDELTSLLENLKRIAMHQPNWVYSDLLIDSRTLENNINLYSNIYYSDLIQKQLDELKERISYPVLDRELESLYEDLNEADIKKTVESIFTVTYGETMFTLTENIINTLVLAVLHGSFTQLLLVRKHIQGLSFKLFEKYPYDDNFSENLYQQIFLNENSHGNLSKLFTFINNRHSIKPSESEAIYLFANNISLEVKKIKAKSLVFGYLGYYFSDEAYDLAQKEMSEFIDSFISNYNAYYATSLIEAVEKNTLRIDIDIIVKLCDGMLTKNYTRHAMDTSKVIVSVVYDRREDSEQSKIIELIKKILSNDDFRKHAQIDNIIIAVSKVFSSAKLKEITTMIEAYNAGDYFIDMNNPKEAVNKNYLIAQEYIKETKKGGSTQFIGYSVNPFRNIRIVFAQKKGSLDDDYINQVINGVSEALFIEGSHLEWKIDMLKILFDLYEKYENTNKSLNEVISKTINNSDILLKDKLRGMGNDFCIINNLIFMYYLFKTIVGNEEYSYEVSRILITTEFQEKYNKTNLDIINWYVDTKFFKDKNIYSEIILHHLYKHIDSEVRELRIASIRNIFSVPFISKSNIQELVLNIFENEPSSYTRFVLANEIYLLEDKGVTREFIAEMKIKIQQDNNYRVRNTKRYFHTDKQ